MPGTAKLRRVKQALASEVRELSAEELDLFRKQGYVVRERALPEARLVHLREAVEDVHRQVVAAAREQASRGTARVERIDGRRFEQVLGSVVKWEWDESSETVRSMEPVHHLHPELDALLDDPRLVAPSAGLLGVRDLSLFTDKLNFKRPGGSPFPWHQDAPYWAFGCDHLGSLVSLQLYLDDADAQNGCLWILPGSHRHGVLPSQEGRGVLGRLYTDVSHVDAGDPVPIEAPAGSVIFFDGYVVHGSRGNRAQASRRALVLTYQPAGYRRWNQEDVRPVAPASS